MEIGGDMRKIKNPYDLMPGYNCFGCSEHSDGGLQMEFWEEDDKIISFWEPRAQFQGYFNILHGGIQSTMMDEIASWVVFVKLKTAGVTSKMEVKYRRPVYMDDGKITLKATLLEQRKKLAKIHVELYDANHKLCTEAEVTYFLFSAEKAVEEFKYPGFDGFFPNG